MAQLPAITSITAAFTSDSIVEANITWEQAVNLADAEQLRVRWVRRTADTTDAAPTLGDVTGQPERSSSAWSGNFTSGGRTYQYKDDRITSIDNTPPFDTLSASVIESGLTGYEVWVTARLEVADA